jgi:hypothetical protein
MDNGKLKTIDYQTPFSILNSPFSIFKLVGTKGLEPLTSSL